MSFFKILHYPDKRLRMIAQPVSKIDNNIKNIIEKMIKTMYQEEGIGLAATQINIQLQIIVISKIEEQKQNLILINPKIIQQNGSISIEEGCLSVPEYRAFIPRSKYITVEATNINGKKIKIDAKSILSICIQHEIDHLNGKLFIDYLSRLKQERLKKKYKKYKKNKNFT